MEDQPLRRCLHNTGVLERRTHELRERCRTNESIARINRQLGRTVEVRVSCATSLRVSNSNKLQLKQLEHRSYAAPRSLRVTVEAVLERPPRRLVKPAAADREAALLEAGRGACPVLCVDALLPYQRLPLAFDDAALTELLEDVGEGGCPSWRRRDAAAPSETKGHAARVEGKRCAAL